MKLLLILFLLLNTSFSQYYNHSLRSFISELIKPEKLTEEIRNRTFHYNQSERRILKNAIFASNGYKFSNDTLAKYFKSFQWYKPSEKQLQLNDIDLEKINFIKEIDDNWDRDFKSFIELFKKPILPYTIDKIDHNKSKIKNEDLIKFLGEVPNSSWGLPVINIRKDSNHTIIIYSMETASGGYSSDIKAIIFNSNGERVLKQNLGRMSGDYSFSSNCIIEITKELEFFCWQLYEEYADYNGNRLIIKKNKSLKILNNKLDIIIENKN